jgi:hypothetical protein
MGHGTVPGLSYRLLTSRNCNSQLTQSATQVKLSQCYVTTDGQSASLSWCQAPSGAQDQIFVTVRQTVAGLLMWCALSDERTGRLQFLSALANAIILGSEFRGTRDHILLSQSRDSPNLEGQVPVFNPPGTGWSSYIPRHWVLFSSPPTTRRNTVEVFEAASTRKTESTSPVQPSKLLLAFASTVVLGFGPRRNS